MPNHIHGGRLLDLVPAGRLEKYLNTVSRSSGLDLVLLEGGTNSSMGGDGAAPEPGGVWSGLSGIVCEAPGEKDSAGGGLLMYEPVRYRGAVLGMLALHTPSPERDRERARQVLVVSSSHIESLADAGYEVESLSGEVVRVYEELALVYGLISRLGAMVDVHEICRVVAEEARKVLDARDVLILLADEGSAIFRTVLALGEHRADAMGFSPGLEEGLVGASYVGHRSIIVCEVDEDRRHTGWPYPVRRFMTVPLISEGRVIGMFVATDKRDGEEFNTREEKLLSAMSSVAAISIKNAQLYTNIKNLLEGFIGASVTAVESRDPSTAGHSSRVAYLSTELAKRVSESGAAPYDDVSYSAEDLLEIHYAGLLHDFGKIGVRETVLLKGSKLPRGNMELIRERFALIAEQKRRKALEAKLELINGGGEADIEGLCKGIDARLSDELSWLAECARIVESANNPRLLPEEDGITGRLEEIAVWHYDGEDGDSLPYLTQSEFENLSMRRGSLNQDERREVESHVLHGYNFLNRVPWSKGYSNIADIVLAHHERLDGSGYPRGVKGNEIPLQAKIMAVADVYDALTAWDRPYKDAVSTQKALFILDMLANEGKLEPHLVQIFRDARVYDGLSGMLPEHPGRKVG